MLMYTVLMLFVVMIPSMSVLFQVCTVLNVNNSACHNLGTTCSLTWIHTTHILA